MFNDDIGTKSELSGYDIDLQFGLMQEQKIADLFKGKGKIEVKAERGMWKTTGNIAIEVRFEGRKSGLSTVKADWWMHLLTSDGEIDMIIMIPVEKLRKITSDMYMKGDARLVYGGDKDKSQLVLLPINKLAEYAHTV